MLILLYQLRHSRIVRQNLSHNSSATLVHSIVTGLDFCNALLAGLPKARIRQLQSVLKCAVKCAAWVVASLPKFKLLVRYTALASD